MLGIVAGLLYTNAGEWLVHKHILHGRGKKKSSFWSFHFHDHHRAARTNDHVDEAYKKPLRGWNPQTKEAVALAASALAHLPLAPVAPMFTATVVAHHVWYYRVHKKSHLEPGWAREHLPWHYDHHMGPNQDSNWCVTMPWTDWVMGTREVYAGTEREERDLEKKRSRAARRAA